MKHTAHASHTHSQASRANNQTKACQRVCQFQHTADRNDAANFKENNTDENARQCTTSGIKHWGLSGYSSVLPRIKFGVTGQESSPHPQRFHTAVRRNALKIITIR